MSRLRNRLSGPAPIDRRAAIGRARVAALCGAFVLTACSVRPVTFTPDGPGDPRPTTSFFIGGHVMGLAGSGLVLQNNAADELSVRADGTFVFPAPIAPGGAFDVTVKTHPLAPEQRCVVTGGAGIVASGNVTTVVVNCAADAFTVGGTVNGLVGSGLVLLDNAGDAIPVNASGAFAFPAALPDGAHYAVTVKTQPANPRQTCRVTAGAGTLANGNVTDLIVTCVTDAFHVGGTVSGLASAGLVLRNNGGDDLAIAGDGPFTFTTVLADLSAFEVTVAIQPSGPAQICSVAGSSGSLAGGDTASVVVNCASNLYPIGGTVTGLVGAGLVVQNGDDPLTLTANGSFAFARPVADQGSYDVRIVAQPQNPWQTCAVANATGSVAHGAVSSIAITCTTNAYAVGGTLSGLADGETVVLQNAGGDDLALGADGAFRFPSRVASGAAYLATVRANPSAPISQTCSVTAGTGVVADAAVVNIMVACVTNRYTIGGTVTGLSGTGLVLRNTTGSDLAVSASGPFQFPISLDSGTRYAVEIATQPGQPAQTCVVTGGAGTVTSGNIVSIAVTCDADRFTVGGTVSGLDGVGLVLQDNGGGDLPINANGGFAFPSGLPDLSSYAVTVRSQPADRSQTCSVTNGAGSLAGANVTDVAITCVTNRYTIGGTVTGLAGTGLVLHETGGDRVPVTGNGTFSFATRLVSGASYAVTVEQQPSAPRQTCTITGGTGVVTAGNVVSMAVSCTTARFTVGGTVTGLTGAGLVLRNAGGDDLAVAANGGFTFATALDDLSAYAVTVRTQPAGPSQTCSVAGGAGALAGANITNVAVSCVTNRYLVGGSVTGLGGSGLVLRNNGGDDLPVAASGAFRFATSLASGASYAVSVGTQPGGPAQSCVVMGSTGTVVSGDVTSVAVSCTTSGFVIGGSVSGLAGSGLVLRNNGGDSLAIAANGTFGFATALADLSTYAVTVQTQPAGPSQTCGVANGTGAVAGASVTTVAVSCVTRSFTLGGSASGLDPGQAVVLRNNGGNDLSVNANGGFAFPAPIASGAAYSVTVATSPAGKTCGVASGAGTVGASNVTTVAVTCIANTYPVGGTVSGLGTGQSVVLQDNAADPVTVSANGGFTFATPIASGATYAVTVAASPAGRTCTVANGAGTIVASAVSNVAVTCAPTPHRIGGTVSGLTTGQSVVLRNNGTDNLTALNGGFLFATLIATGAPYAVTVLSTPADRACTVANGAGIVGVSDITNVAISCIGVCVPSCAGRECGGDGCSGSCGSCGAGETCSGGTCVCAPSCAGRSCGPDGCGGSCGNCGPGQTCSGGSCVCVPSCSGKTCGPDGCGGSCGACGPGQACSGGACVCVPSCSGKTCGPDGCGGSCGDCGPGQACSGGTCVCVPSCSGKTCGPDGCGGSCGACGPGQACSGGACVCAPTCEATGRECGSDGCGGSCGSCSGSQRCITGICR